MRVGVLKMLGFLHILNNKNGQILLSIDVLLWHVPRNIIHALMFRILD